MSTVEPTSAHQEVPPAHEDEALTYEGRNLAHEDAVPGREDLAPAPDDVAITGLALRFPGADTLEEFGEHLVAGRSLISEVPAERWSKEDYFGDPRRGAQKTNSVWGGFIEHADRFDADFFNISPREAESMDPQQRIALELAWQAVENAGYAASALAGTETGVFMGVCHADYAELMEREGVRTDVYFPTGTAYSIIANRISYHFDFQGPSITNDTACSSSLVSVYEAVRALRNGDCALALAGGVNLIWSPKHFVAFSQASMLSRTGRARAFDESADGYVRGEGGAVLLLKPLARAVEDGDTVHAVIKGVATNHGGRTNSLTVTNPAAQSRLIERLYTRAGIRPETVGYIEAHGPGTPVGDPIEIMALKRAFGNLHAAQGTVARPDACGIGSVKTNIGHLEGAAGVAGIAKVISAFARRVLPATVNFEKQNKLIRLDGTPFHIVRDTRPWDTPPARADGTVPPRRAGVSSFGFGGTNAHLVLEEHLPHDGPTVAASGRGPELVPLSARTPERLRAVARRLRAHLRGRAAPTLADVAHTLRAGREQMPARVAFVVTDRDELVTLLGEFIDGADETGRIHVGDSVRGADGDPDATVEAAERWADGATADWAEPSGHRGTARTAPRRVPLPAYPFARERHWFRAPGRDAATTVAPSPAATAAAHPFLRDGGAGPEGGSLGAVFDGREPFLASHVVSGERVLPAAAQVELVHAAVARATGRDERGPLAVRLRDVVWRRPIVVRDAPVEATVGLAPQDGGALTFEISTGTGTAAVHCSGTAGTGDHGKPERLDLDRIRAACPTQRVPRDVYAALRDRGLEYGPAMRGLREIRLGEGELLARIGAPGDGQGTEAGFVLPPSVLDAAFQSSLLLLTATGDGRADGPPMPFAFEDLTVHGPCPSETWAWVRRRARHSTLDVFDIDLCDAGGAVTARLRGLVQRTSSARRDTAAGTGVVTATTQWTPAPSGPDGRDATQAPHVHVHLGGRAAHPDTLTGMTGVTAARLPDLVPGRVADAVAATTGHVFGQVAEVVRSSPRTPHRFVVLVDDRVPRQVHAPLVGLFRTVVLENPRVSGRVVRVAELDAAPPERIAGILRTEVADESADCEIRHAPDGTRHVARTVEVDLTEGPAIPPLKEGGVYWITGGLGGLGLHTARYFGRRAGITVVLSGRSAPGAASEAAVRELRASGVDVHHLPVDVAVKEEVERAVRTIEREHGRLDGIVHAAGVLRDAYVYTKDAADLHAVLAPKVDGVLNLDAASRDTALDFFVVFSSVAGVFGNPAQSDYAAANAFLDAFAHHRRALADAGERSGRTVAVSWPLWADGGMSVDHVTREAMRRERGWEPLPTEAGLRLLGRVLGDGPAHLVVAYGASARLTTGPAPVPTDPPAPAAAPAAATGEELTRRTTDLLRRVVGEVLHRDPGTIDETVDLIAYGIDSLSILETTASLEAFFGPLPKTIFFEHTTLAGVAGYFVEEHADRLASVLDAGDPTHPAASPHDVADVPDERDAPEVRDTPGTRDGAPVPAAPVPDAPEARMTAEPPTVPDARTARVPAVDAPHVRHDARHDARDRDARHDIAVIGVAGTYPGAETLGELWPILEQGRHQFREVPRERWDHDAIYSRDRSVPGRSSIRTGTFLREIDMFDPRYFRISKRDAEAMSPEVRLFLQTVVHALEDAGYSRETIQRRYDGDVGVLAGSMSNHYGLYGFQNSLVRGSAATGSYTATLPNMVSYFYGFTGPSLFVDTMCSGSSTCVHQAVQMLRAGECRMAVAGGVNLLLHPYNLITSSHEHFTTTTSEVIRSFGVGADGTILGEGVGALVLKPLVEAERDGDHVYGVIKGTALANAGVRNGFTVPSPRMQARAIRKAIDDAGIDPRTIGYVEAHGSGTSLGDPIEVKALTTAFRTYTQDTGFCAIGSVKSNMGHLLHAAGMIGITKVLLQLQKGRIAPSLHSDVINPDIDFSRTPFRLQRRLTDWEPVVTTVDGRRVSHPRRAGITSIGAGGMNSHIIVEEYTRADTAVHGGSDGREELFVFSAMNEAVLEKWLARFRAHLAAGSHEPADLASVAFTLRVGRNELPCRWAFFARTADEAVAALDRRLAGDRDLGPALASTDPASEGLRALARAWAGGRSVDWREAEGDPRALRRVPLPPYPFERVRCWVEPERGAPTVIAPLALREKLHPLLGRNASDVDGPRYVLDVHLDDLLDYGYTSGERRDSTPGIVPTFAVELALAVTRVSGFAEGAVVRRLRLLAPVDWRAAARLVTVLDAADRKAASGTVFVEEAQGARVAVAEFDVRAGDPARTAATGVFGAGTFGAGPYRGLRADDPAADAVAALSRTVFLAELAEGALGYAPERNGTESAYRMPDGRLVLDVLPPELLRDHVRPNVTLPPHVLAAVAQGLQFEAKRLGAPDWARTTPRRIDEIRLFAPGSDIPDAVRYVVLDVTGAPDGLGGRVALLDEKGEVVAVLSDLWCGEGEAPRTGPAAEAARAVAGAEETGRGPGEAPAGKVRDDLVSFAVDELRDMASGILKYEAAELDARTGFDAFGFDSISLVALAGQVRDRLGVDLTPAAFFDLNTFESLGGHLVAEYGESLRPAYERSRPTGPAEETAPDAGAGDGAESVDRAEAEVEERSEAGERVEAAPARTAPARTAPGAPPLPIAVIGAAGRFPDAPDLRTYWTNLVEGRDSVTEFPLHRYDAAYARIVESADFPHHAGVLDDVDAFDAAFFQILPREAELMDPQHRLALETVWNALEHSGYTPAGLPESTGLFFGVSGTDYATLLSAHGTPPDAFTSTGNAHSMLANRISYVLDIHGPSEPVDTACSSSLVAVHRAVEAIRSGACDAAIAGGVNLLLGVDTFVSAARAGMLSPEGRCKTFASDADGYVRGEGVGAVVLKPLADAERDGDAILGVIVGSAENHGGRANSLTAPNGAAQADLVVRAMGDTDPATIGYVEAHGTGTALGDPVEVRALRTAFRRLGGTGRGTCGLGSVKTNIGHLEAAAGIAGLLKVLLAMEHGTLPATRNCDEINPFVQLDGSPFRIVRERETWKRPRDRHGLPAPRRAGVSSFGFGGANCHVVVEEYVAPDALDMGHGRNTGHALDTGHALETGHGRDGGHVPYTGGAQGMAVGDRVVVPLSARTRDQLRERARDLLAYLEETPRPAPLGSIGRTLQFGRDPMAERAGWVVASHEELAERLRAFLDGGTAPAPEHGTAPGKEHGAGPGGGSDAAGLLARWTGGADTDWHVLYGRRSGPALPPRTHLPTYPFARDRYWIPAGGDAGRDRAAAGVLPGDTAAGGTPAGARGEGAARGAGAPIGTTLLVPRWTPKPAMPGVSGPVASGPADRKPHRHHAVVLCDTAAHARTAVERRLPDARCHTVRTTKTRPESRFTDLSRQVFEIVREVVREAPDGGALVQVVTPAQGDQAVGLALAGLLRTASLEHVVVGQVVGLEGERDADAVAELLAADARHPEDELVRHRGAERHVRTWEPRTSDGTRTPWRAGGVYLVTGGAGGIGALVARRIARDVDAPVLVLVGRSPQDARVDRLLAELREAGATARYAVADVSRWEEVRHLVARTVEEYGGIHGIVHAAGVIRDGRLPNKTAEQWEAVLAPKVDGMVHLDRATARLALDFFLAFSSGAAVTGNPGQADYATANAYLDAYAAVRNSRVAAGERPGRTLAIAWPLWKDGGMTVDDATRARLRRERGLVPMESDEGIETLLRAWRLGEAGEDRIWVHHGETAKAVPPPGPARPTASVPASAPLPDSGPVPASAPGAVSVGRERETLRSVVETFARVTGLPVEDVDADRPLADLALDSVMVIQLNRELSIRYGEVPTTLFYEFPTLRAVAGRLAGPAAVPVPASAPAAGDGPSGPAAAVRAAVPRPAADAPDESARPERPVPDEAIAIIGLSGRYPHAGNIEEFWENLKAGRDCVTEIPPRRWPLDGFYEPARAKAIATGRSYHKWGGFLEDFDAFDPAFFRIAPRDAYAMDPQERLFLQAAWEVIEDAGYTPEELARRHRRRVGVFAGVTKSGHARHGAALLPSGETVVPSLSFASLSARTSYALDLCGPSLTIDTMCSSSLTAIHEACEHLRRGACELAVAGGVNLYLHPSDYVELCRSTMLSTRPRLRSFGKGGDGFVPGEGVGAVLLKPLGRALADGDRILAVVRGTGVNHGGRTHGYTVPSPTAQAELIDDALTRAGISARRLSYVEAHGTGTELGDPIEVQGLSLAFERSTRDKQFCAIGSVKSTIGHLEAAAGIAGLTKTVLQLRHRTLVPSLHCEEPNPGIRFEETPFFVQRTLEPWESEGPRIAAVSSFGAGGSNAHVVIEEYVADETVPEPVPEGGEQLVVLSARTPERLREAAARLAAYLERGERDAAERRDISLTDLAHTLRTGRRAMRERLALTVSSLAELRHALHDYATAGDGVRAPGLHRGSAGSARGAAAEIAADDELRELLVERWVAAGKLDKLAALWADGVELDWHGLHPVRPRRVSLPTYPFAKDRYWIGDLEPAGEAGPGAAAPISAPRPRNDAAPHSDAASAEASNADAPPTGGPLTGAPETGGPPTGAPDTGGPTADGLTREGRVAATVRARVADVLAMPQDELDGALAFADHGLDSILAVRLVHLLNETFGLDLPTGVVFDHSSPDRLVAHLLAEYEDIGAVAPTPAATTPPVPAASPVLSTPPATTVPPAAPRNAASSVLPDAVREPAPAPAFAPAPPSSRPASGGPLVAVVGMSGRFPGSDTLDELWTHLVDGDDLVTEATRWDLPGTGPDGSPRCTRGGFLRGIDEFDPLFFRISGVEAAAMDPQQRLLLQESWRALEDAGHAGGQLDEARCGVYVGCWSGDYQDIVGDHGPAQAFTGNMASFTPARVSYYLNLKGPALAVDTACSSSLVAIDLACRGLRSGETDLALAGGVFVQSTPRLYELAGRAGMLSATGRCHTFDRRADGFVPGEGVGVVVLKRLDDALADGDHIHGVIRASGTNQDGATNGITAPSSASQERLLRDTHASFGVDAGTIGLVEAHGTGTPLGDPIEFSALDRAFRASTTKSGYCALGSVKTNIGHTQFAAGVAGVLKVLLSLRHRRIPASLHFETANAAIRLDGSPFYMSTRDHRWEAPSGGGPRRGAVSSFGAGGTNAHLVIEEAPPTTRTRRTTRPAHLVLLSAHSREQLARQVALLAAHCRRETSLDLGDLAYTLTVGRAGLAHRFACVARDRTDLLRILGQGLDGPDACTGHATRTRTTGADPEADAGAARLRRCADPARTASADLHHADLTALAAHFTRGTALDYGRAFAPGAHLRVPLPTYPFARESHWAGPVPPADPPAPSPVTAHRPTAAHPLIHETSPAGDVGDEPGTLRATTVFKGDEPVLRDHTVRGQRVLPGVVHLEMARETAARALGVDAGTPLRMRDITWIRPLVQDQEPVTVDVLVKPARSGGDLIFEISSRAEGATASVVCSTGRVAVLDTSRPERVDIAPLRADGTRTVPAERIREALASMGIVHGPSLRAVREAHVGEGTVLAALDLPTEADPAGAPYILHPALMDSAIQASTALHITGGAQPPETAVPFALDRLEILAPCRASMRAVIRVADPAGEITPLSGLDVDLVDEDGQVCVRMTGYTSRRAKGPVPELFAPVWEPADTRGHTDGGAPAPGHILVVGGTDEQRAALTARYPRVTTWGLAPGASADEAAERLRTVGPIDHLLWIAPETGDTAPDGPPALHPTDTAGFVAARESGVIAAFRLIKALLRTGHDARPLGITLVTRRALATYDTEPTAPAHAGLHGLFGSLGHEYTHWSVHRTDLGTTTLPGDLLTLPVPASDGPLAHRAGQWLVRRWAPDEPAGAREQVYRQGGVYVVIGGAGGLGVVWTRHVVERYGAHVVWIGRRPHDDEIEAKLRACGGDVRYVSADAADSAALRRARARIVADHPRIHGVVHAALVLRDRSLARMDEPTLRAALTAKVDATVATAEVFADDALDFMLFFSSVQSFTTAAGQSNYAAGSTFTDAYAQHLSRHRPYPVKVMNWGWWGSTGSASSQLHRESMARWGLISIEPPEAMRALDTLLGGPQRQVAFVRSRRPDALTGIDPGSRITVHERARTRVTPDAVRAGVGAPADPEALRAVADWRRTERDPLLARMLRAHLETLGVLPGPGTTDPRERATRVAELRERAGILPGYDTWLDHALRVVPPSGPSPAEARREWERYRERWSADPDKKAEAALLDATLQALPDILTGRTRPTDILFPQGSVALVEGTYRNNRIADLYNRAMADAAAAVVAERLRLDPGARLRILEIGAGTGSTSVGMFAALRPFQEHIETYLYTDLSKAFLNHARTAYGPQVPYLAYARFDAERPLAGQGVEAGGHDLVIAANVLHATRDTRNTIRNAKAALRDGGWLLLNELAAFDVFSHLTFGLLEGWWLFEDHALRIPGSPALSPDNWRRVLESEGFRSSVFVLPQAHELGQQIIAAESDGIVRQAVSAPERAAPAPRRPRPGIGTGTATGTGTRPGIVAPPAPHAVPAPERPLEPVREPAREPASGTTDPASPVRRRSESPAGTAATMGTRESARTAGAPAVPAPEERAETMARYLREQAARTLGIPADRIAPSAPLSDYGLDSILVLQLTNALREDLGDISSTLLFDAESVEGLTAHFLENGGSRVDGLVARLRPDAPEPSPARTPDAPEPPPARLPGAGASRAASPARPAAGLLRTAVETGSPEQAADLLSAAARIRPVFAAGDGPEPATLRLSDGAGEQALVCLPSLVAPTGAHQYVKFATALHNRRQVWTAAIPGYAVGEPLPVTLDAAADTLATTLLRRLGERPFALAAYSSGGWLAHEVVRRLEKAGAPPAALVLLDTPRSTGTAMARGMCVLTRRLLEKLPQLPVIEEQFTAMACYAQLLDGWRPGPVATPTVLVRAADSTALLGDGTRAGWPVDHELLEVTGDHFSMLEEHAGATALAVHRWLSTLGHGHRER
ncbi:SDR family NAD(P)-dependent oxidoreductase [Streptomyces sp. NPDC014744]|uniref:SDR family NAD(P)-dependent oxidoreductase n=1 Tax=Streptomyces sp. NPDC014744 TaxID=3364903 RepID=UPI003701E8D4